MSSRDDDDRDEADLRVLLDDLESTLSALQAELSAESGRRTADDQARDGTRDRTAATGIGGDSRRGRSGRSPPRPPSLRDLFRFTEQYTLPTVISLLETTIQSLELLRGVLRVADPDRSAFDKGETGRARASDLGDEVTRAGRDAVSGMGRGAVSGLERALSELQRALSESDLPEDQSSRELLEDAQRLSGEVADRLAAAQQGTESERYGYRDDVGGESRSGPDTESDAVTIDVSDDLDRTGEDGLSGEDTDDEKSESTPSDRVEIDVEAELASIKDDVQPREAAGETGADSDTEDGETDSESGGRSDETAAGGADPETAEAEGGSDSPDRESPDSGGHSADEPDEDEP